LLAKSTFTTVSDVTATQLVVTNFISEQA